MVENVRNAMQTINAATTTVSQATCRPALRTVMVITNTSTGGQAITLSFGQEAVAGQGIVLYPTGAWCETLDSKFIPSQQEINAISSAAGGTIAIHERILS